LPWEFVVGEAVPLAYRSSPSVNAWNPTTKGGERMADDEKLKPEDFPVHTEEKKIVKTTVKLSRTRAIRKSQRMAERLNADEDLREQDRWSA
jgi:hypothetical protein